MRTLAPSGAKKKNGGVNDFRDLIKEFGIFIRDRPFMASCCFVLFETKAELSDTVRIVFAIET